MVEIKPQDWEWGWGQGWGPASFSLPRSPVIPVCRGHRWHYCRDPGCHCPGHRPGLLPAHWKYQQVNLRVGWGCGLWGTACPVEGFLTMVLSGACWELRGFGTLPKMDIGYGQSLWRWARSRGIVNKGLGVSGSQGEQQRLPSMRTWHPLLKRVTLKSSVAVSDSIADTQGSSEVWRRGWCKEPRLLLPASPLGHYDIMGKPCSLGPSVSPSGKWMRKGSRTLRSSACSNSHNTNMTMYHHSSLAHSQKTLLMDSISRKNQSWHSSLLNSKQISLSISM